MRGQNPTRQNEQPVDSESAAELTIDLTTPLTGGTRLSGTTRRGIGWRDF